jgi:hypothetical protein
VHILQAFFNSYLKELSPLLSCGLWGLKVKTNNWQGMPPAKPDFSLLSI